VAVSFDGMESTDRPLVGIDMDHRQRQKYEMVQKLMTHFGGDLMAVGHGQAGRHSDVHFGVQPVAEPTRAMEDRFHRLPDDTEDGDGDDRADNGIGKEESKRNADGGEQHREMVPPSVRAWCPSAMGCVSG